MIKRTYSNARYSAGAKVKIFSHNDLDGVGCGIVAKLAFNQVDATYCGYHNINERVTEFIAKQEYENYDHVFITDISVNEEVESLINDRIEMSNKVTLLDHHATALHLNKNFWANVQTHGKVQGNMFINSGTNMLFELLSNDGLFNDKIYRDGLACFVEKIRRYDSWEWHDIYNDEYASQLNQLFWLYGQSVFESRYILRFKQLTICKVREGLWMDMFNGSDRAVITVDTMKKDSYINRKEKQMIKGRLVGYNAGFVFAEQYISELGNELSERHQDLDFIVILDLGNKKASFRTTHDHIDLGKDVAGKFGGGGHAKASGCQLDANAVKMVLPMLFGSKKLTKKLINVITGKGLIGKIGKIVDKLTKN